MTENMIELARRAVACKGWRWIAGMKAIRHEEHCTSWFRIEETLRRLTGDWASALPDLSDPATLGCLLALVREAWGQATLSPVSCGLRRWCLADFGTTALQGDSEAELLVAALENAPKKG